MALNIPDYLKIVNNYEYKFSAKDLSMMPIQLLILTANQAAMRMVLLTSLSALTGSPEKEIDEQIEKAFALIFNAQFEDFVAKYGTSVKNDDANMKGN